jgi:hypothetical protein
MFLDRFSKNLQIQNFMEILLVTAELFHANGRADRGTDMTKLIVASDNFANSPKIQFQNSVSMLFPNFPTADFDSDL